VPSFDVSRGLDVPLIVVVLFLGIPMTDGEKMIATSATISNNPRNLPRLHYDAADYAKPGLEAEGEQNQNQNEPGEF